MPWQKFGWCRRFIFLACALTAPISLAAGSDEVTIEKPNIVIIFCDDVGYGDLACFGNPTVATPNLDRMASEGMKFTQFYAAASVCTPSRAGLLTGRLPIRSGMCSDKRRVLFPDSKGGLPVDEITIAEVLKSQGYATGCFGKWHLGHHPQYLPTNQGFDRYVGIPYSNDMDRIAESPQGRAAFLNPEPEYWNVPLMENEKIIERPADQTKITRRYTDESVAFIHENKDKPFFVYLPHSMAHVPLFASEAFLGKSKAGLYGDVMEEVDWSVGQILTTLKELNIDKKTLVFFTSDNGPWLIFDQHGGSAGPLRMGKGSTWEGGMREPTIAWWPGQIEPGSVCREIASTMDIFATVHRLTNTPMPDDRVYDSHDLTPLLKQTGKSTRKTLFYYRGNELMAVRMGPWKAHFKTRDGYGPGAREAITHDPPLLFQLEIDPGEKHNVAAKNQDVIEKINAITRTHRSNVTPAISQLENKNF